MSVRRVLVCQDCNEPFKRRKLKGPAPRHCPSCQQKRERDRQAKSKRAWYWTRGGKEKMAAAAADPMAMARERKRKKARRKAAARSRPCQGCGQPVARGVRDRLCLTCKAEREERRRNDIFRHKTYSRVRCPVGMTFDAWLEYVQQNPLPSLPDLTREPDNFRPLKVPKYLHACSSFHFADESP